MWNEEEGKVRNQIIWTYFFSGFWNSLDSKDLDTVADWPEGEF